MIPRYVQHRERLTPGAPPIEVELPQSRNDVWDLLSTINRLAIDDPTAWKMAVRQWTSVDWYVLAYFLTGSQRLDPFTGRPEIDCDFQFNWSREMQFDGDNVIDKSARESGKSTWRCYVGVTNEVINNPNLTVGIFAFEKAAAERHGRRLKEEWETNRELQSAWDDVFYREPSKESSLWTVDKGLAVKRTIVSATPTVFWCSILELPVGTRLGLGILDDIETEKTASTEMMRKQTEQRVNNAFNLGGRGCRWWINGTHTGPLGIIAGLEKTGAWRVRCHTAEDVTQPAPDIAKLYDESDGFLPIRGESRRIPLPPEVRNVRLAGKPVYLHPLECALKRLRMGNEMYSRHNQGDALAGQDRRLAEEWLRYYETPPRQWAAGANLYILIDPSKGSGDPTFARVEACKADETISWVGGLRKKLNPSQFGPAIFSLAMEWAKVGNLMEIRVEEFGQSTWGFHLRTYFESMNHYVCRIVSCANHVQSNKESDGRQREWSGLEPLYRGGRRLWPKDGLRVFDEDDHPLDLVDYYREKEYKMFPLPVTDDGLASDYLLTVTKGKAEDGSTLVLDLIFPESDDDYRPLRRQDRESFDVEGATWMSEAWC